jgi:hypothetical protein
MSTPYPAALCRGRALRLTSRVDQASRRIVFDKLFQKAQSSRPALALSARASRSQEGKTSNSFLTFAQPRS